MQQNDPPVPPRRFFVPMNSPGEAAWHPSGARLAVGGLDGVARILDTTSGAVERSVSLKSPTLGLQLRKHVYQLAWNP